VLPTSAEIQRALAERILGGEAPELEAWIDVPRGVDAAKRLAAHINGYPARIEESLGETYPALRHVLGDGDFAELADRYRPHLPPGESNLGFVGSELPAFLTRERLVRDLPFLVDLARLEWAVWGCFHARLVASFEASTCAAWTPDEWSRACVHFQPGVAVVRSRWPVRSLRECRNVAREDVDLDLMNRPENVVVYREGLTVVTRAVADLEAEMLDRLAAGESLGRLAARIADRGASPAAVSTCFTTWADSGLIARCDLG
jgi:hypothetical protein